MNFKDLILKKIVSNDKKSILYTQIKIDSIMKIKKATKTIWTGIEITGVKDDKKEKIINMCICEEPIPEKIKKFNKRIEENFFIAKMIAEHISEEINVLKQDNLINGDFSIVILEHRDISNVNDKNTFIEINDEKIADTKHNLVPIPQDFKDVKNKSIFKKI